ncbi:hypothetical protein EOL70_00160 [Leucothrix sargassi]|nr:hypothetical protein EOL70_00160 [Leucothrix sargassi]
MNVKQYSNSTLFQFATANKFTVVGFVVSLILTVVLSSTMLADAIYFNDPKHKDIKIEGWMTPRYISLSYGLPRNMVFDLLDVTEDTRGRRRADHLAKNIGVSLDELTDMVRAAAVAHRSQEQADND